MSDPGRDTEGASTIGDRQVYVRDLMTDLEHQQPDVWKFWAGDGSAVLFRAMGAPFGTDGRITLTTALDARRGRVHVAWGDGPDRGALVVKLAAIPCPVAGLVWRWICPWTGFLCDEFALLDPTHGPPDGAA